MRTTKRTLKAGSTANVSPINTLWNTTPNSKIPMPMIWAMPVSKTPRETLPVECVVVDEMGLDADSPSSRSFSLEDDEGEDSLD